MSDCKTCDASIVELKLDAFINEKNIFADIIPPALSATNFNELICAKVVNVIVIYEAGGDCQMIILPFTSNDVIAGKLIKNHGFNRRISEVAITDNDGLEYSPRVKNLPDMNRVEIDLSRYDIAGTWFLRIS
jgi:hypothetical protein